MSDALLGCWIDGSPAAQLAADDRGLQYGDGLFETVVVRAGVPRFLEAHLARLALGCARLGIRFEAWRELRVDIDRAAGLAPALCVLKIIVTRGSAVRRGYRPEGDEQARRIVSLWPSAALDVPASGVELRVASLRLSESAALGGLKHLNRLENVLAASESRDPRYFEALLLSSADDVICGTMSNIFVVRAGALLTPPVVRSGVAGVMRGVVLREAPRLGIAVTQGRVKMSEFGLAAEVFITNARIGVVPVARVGEHSFTMRTLTTRLRAHIETLDA